MNALFIGIALTPLTAYFCLMGLLNSRRSPAVTSGARDMGALLLGISGMIFAGPCVLLTPESVFNRFSPWPWLAWVLLIVLYSLFCNLILLMMRPKIIVYNIKTDRLRSILKAVVAELDPEAQWAGDSALIPRLGVQMHIDASGLAKNVQIASSGPHQNLVGWHRLQSALAVRLREVPSPSNPLGILLSIVSGVAILGILGILFRQAPEVQAAFCELMRIF